MLFFIIITTIAINQRSRHRHLHSHITIYQALSAHSTTINNTIPTISISNNNTTIIPSTSNIITTARRSIRPIKRPS